MSETDEGAPEPLSEQVNIRLTKSDHDVVQALIFLGEGSSANEVLRNAVRQFISTQRTDDDVQDALAVLARHRAKREGKITSLREKVRRPKGTA